MSRSLLEARQQRLLVTRLDVDHPLRPKARLSKCCGEQIMPRDAPKDLTLRPRCDPRREQCSRSAIDGPIAAAGDFVKRSDRKPSVR